MSRKRSRAEVSVGRHVAAGSVDPDLPLTPDGVVYHLACRGKDIADKFIFVGDPGRVPIVAERFDKGSLEFDGSHREIRVMTGKYKGVRVTVLSTGMGTDNVEIVINEIHALKEYDVTTGAWLDDKKRPAGKIHIIRVGTCGCPRADVAVGTLAITHHGIGMDNTCRYYVSPYKPTVGEANLCNAANATGLGRVGVYATCAHPDVTAALVASADAFNKGLKKGAAQQGYIVGTTASGSGFYGCQGRAVGRFRGRLAVPNLVDDLGSIAFTPSGAKGAKQEVVVNIEMENSALCFLSKCLDYKAGTVCAIVARRAGDMREFATPAAAQEAIKNAITIALDALISL
jgi:uridine phosphorylase